MKRLLTIPVLLIVGLGLAACEEEPPPGPPTSKIFIDNESSTEANVRIKFWTKDYKKVSTGNEETIEFVNEQGANVVQVHAKTRKQWDECWVTMNVGQTLVIYDGIERIACRIE